MAKINSINNKSGNLTIDPGSSGDSFVQFDINAIGEFRIGIDDTDGDKFKVSVGSALGTNDAIQIDSNGIIRMEDQPSFLVTNTVTDSNVTGDGTEYTIDVDVERFDQGGDFASDTFTAPVTGRYYLSFVVFTQDRTSSHTSGSAKINTSNRTYEYNLGNPYVQSTTSDNFQFQFSTIADMDASDTATISIIISGGTKVIDSFGTATESYTSFSGALLC